jgi:hypothetical protein
MCSPNRRRARRRAKRPGRGMTTHRSIRTEYVMSPNTTTQEHNSDSDTAETKVRRVLTANPGMTTADLVTAAGVGRSTARRILSGWAHEGTVIRTPGKDQSSLLTLLDGQVQLGAEPAARAAQPVITRLGDHATRRLLLRITLLAGPGRMLMGAADRGVDVQVPRDRTVRVGQGLEAGEDTVPGAVPLPSAEEVVDPVPWPVLGGDVPPWNPGTDPEPYAVDQLPPRPDGRPSRPRAFRQ